MRDRYQSSIHTLQASRLWWENPQAERVWDALSSDPHEWQVPILTIPDGLDRWRQMD